MFSSGKLEAKLTWSLIFKSSIFLSSMTRKPAWMKLASLLNFLRHPFSVPSFWWASSRLLEATKNLKWKRLLQVLDVQKTWLTGDLRLKSPSALTADTADATSRNLTWTYPSVWVWHAQSGRPFCFLQSDLLLWAPHFCSCFCEASMRLPQQGLFCCGA